MVADEVLYRRMVGGDMTAFDLLYTRYERCLFGFVLAQVRDRAEAEDIFHEAFMTLLRERRAELDSFRAWVFQVARNLCRNRTRSRQRAARAMETVARSETAAVPLPESTLASRQAGAALERALAKLPAPLHELYELRVAGLSYEEMAEVLGVPLGTVKSRMHEMVGRLRDEVQPWTAS
jgi:RNA polymerase sigma-70 factor, ECF subfamily